MTANDLILLLEKASKILENDSRRIELENERLKARVEINKELCKELSSRIDKIKV